MSRSNPYVFTEQGIYMLMTVLKGDLAVQQSMALIRLFKQMKDYIAAENAPDVSAGMVALAKGVSIKIFSEQHGRTRLTENQTQAT
nr:hypothetical protein [Fibrobacter sp. UBA2449]